MIGDTRCLLGDAALAPVVSLACRAASGSRGHPFAESEMLRDRPGRSQLFRVELHDGESLVAKRFLCAGHRQPLRERAKAALGAAAARREARALLRLAAAGIAVPELRVLAVERARGDHLLATRRVEGETLRALLVAGGRVSPDGLAQLGAAVRALHAAGFVHGDLHAGNILVSADGPVVIDLQATRRTRSRRARRRDLAFLEHSLAPFLSTADRVRLRAAALGVARPFDASARRALRAVGRRFETRRRSHAARRTRRTGVAGGRIEAFACGDGRGLRDRSVDAAAVARALTRSRSSRGGSGDDGGDWTLLKSGARAQVAAGPAGRGRAVVKRSAHVGPLRRLADALRGSPARRAWLAGHGLRLRGIGAAAPWAYVERRRLGLPCSSAVVVEALDDGVPADACPSEYARADEVAETLLRLLLRLHRAGIDHGDLKASHVLLARRRDALESQLVDLEALRFRRRLGDRRRIRSLAQLNASLPDSFPDALRLWVFDRYAAALPFRSGRRAALGRVVAQSLARGHRWSGRGFAPAGQLSD